MPVTRFGKPGEKGQKELTTPKDQLMKGQTLKKSIGDHIVSEFNSRYTDDEVAKVSEGIERVHISFSWG